jgi:beta-mannosidase
MEETVMFKTWSLKDFDVGAGVGAKAFDGAADEGWIEVEAPGDVYLALTAAGRLAHPFEGHNERASAWVKDREWWYSTRFNAEKPKAGERLALTFLGLDTLAQVWLNGTLLGRSDNMFRAVEFDVGALIRDGQPNTLAVGFTPTATVEVDPDFPSWSLGGDKIKENKRNFLRKAQYGWGWDWGPSLPTVGLWRPVTLRLQKTATLENVKFTTVSISADRSQAKVSVEVGAEVFVAAAGLDAEITLVDPDGGVAATDVVALAGGADRRRAKLEFTLAQPQLWWTPELGAAALYSLKVVLRADGAALETQTLKVGVRTIALDTAPDPREPGTDFFRFVLNGVSLFARGVCWIPADSFIGAIGDARYRALLRQAADANMNMVRIWGGGVYEPEVFYDVCDELGLLVWQDFMFACAPYPEKGPDFVENVRAEAAYQITRLRNHASIAVWCGNNECQVFQGVVNAMARRDDPLPGALYYDLILPQQVADLDPTTPYWPGSPSGGRNANSMRTGDVHSWTVWHGMPPVPDDRAVGRMDLSPAGVAYTRYGEEMGRFISEYGIQASPSLETLRRALPADQLELGSPGLLLRIKDHPKNKIDAMLVSVTGLPATLEDYVDFTQITQAEGLKFGIEHFRRRTPHCSGSLIWQFNDCWPGVSWSLVDYYGFEKAGYFYVKRAYAPVMASFKALDDGAVELWITNDTLDTASGEITIEQAAFAGGAAWTETLAVQAPGLTSQPVWRGDAARVAASPGHVLTVRSEAGLFPDNRHFFAAIKDLQRPAPPPPEVEIKQRGPHELAVHLRAADYLYFVNLRVPFEETHFSDNYFDLRTDQGRTVIVRNPARALRPEDVSVHSR